MKIDMIEQIGNKQEKIWGLTQRIFGNDNVEVHRIEIKQGGYCSKHKHKHKFNFFYVETGSVRILRWRGGQVASEVLFDSGSTFVCPDVFHKFEALSDSIVYEIYWTPFDPSDIIRENEGGLNA